MKRVYRPSSFFIKLFSSSFISPFFFLNLYSFLSVLSLALSLSYHTLRSTPPTVYLSLEFARAPAARPTINIMGAAEFGKFKFLLPELSQIIFSPGPLIFKLRKGLRNYRPKDFLLLTGDPAIIGVACSIVSDMTNGKYQLLKWDKQERKYYAIDINLHEKGTIDE